MRKFGVAAAAATISMIMSTVSFADTKTLATAGYWEAFGGTSDNGTPVCGMSTSGKSLYFSIKAYKGDDQMTVQLGSSDWKIDDGDKQRLSMRFDKNSPWNATGTGFHFSDGSAALEFYVSLKNIEKFITEFAGGSKLHITFDESDVDKLSLTLDGALQVTDTFADCIRKRL
jgi:hypothetical protein